jgi:hypothetical protein
LEEARVQAAKSLAELALKLLPRTNDCSMGVDVRDDRQEVVLVSRFTFKARQLADRAG